MCCSCIADRKCVAVRKVAVRQMWTRISSFLYLSQWLTVRILQFPCSCSWFHILKLNILKCRLEEGECGSILVVPVMSGPTNHLSAGPWGSIHGPGVGLQETSELWKGVKTSWMLLYPWGCTTKTVAKIPWGKVAETNILSNRNYKLFPWFPQVAPG